MNISLYITILLFFLSNLYAIAQKNEDKFTNSTLFLDGVDIIANDSAYRRKYERTKYFVKEIYVYSVLASKMFNQIEDTLLLIENKKEKRKYIKKSYKDLKKEFGYEISQMTITRGHFLMKILHKETGMTAYEIVQKYRGGITAKSWETILRLNSTTLKKIYSPEIEDIVLDKVLKEIEDGKIKPKPRPPVTERGRKVNRKNKRNKRLKAKTKKSKRK